MKVVNTYIGLYKGEFVTVYETEDRGYFASYWDDIHGKFAIQPIFYEAFIEISEGASPGN